MREQTTSTEENTVQAKNKGNWIERAVSQHFTVLLTVLALIGGATAMFLPLVLSSAGQVDSNLRLHILYMTGGIIAVLGLVETHRKNTVDREKAGVEKENYKKTQDHQANVLEEQQRQFNMTMEQEREKIEADKAKNEQDHIRQVHAERRSRYTTAIEQLSIDKASIRLGGVYSLVGLVDEWLADEKTIPNIEERHKEGQVIINNLCAYIRSPFLIAERAEQLDEPYTKDLQKDFDGDAEKFDTDKRAFTRDKAALEEERQIRLSIIQEIRERLGKNNKTGPWSDFDYDFSSTVFFYPTNFSDSLFGASSIFSGATFTDNVNFFGVAFNDYANFRGATFTDNANFSGATFTDYADFNGTKFTDNTHFSGAKFTGYTNFSQAEFTASTHFSGATFTNNANFSGAKFTEDADFSQAEFTKDAIFLWAEFTKKANFFEAKFTGDAHFSEAKFTEDADFSQAEFTKDAIFLWAEFTKKANFFEATFEEKPQFEYALENKTYKARFSCKADPEDYNFKVSHNSPYKIETKEQEHNGIKFIIPKGAELFDPHGWTILPNG